MTQDDNDAALANQQQLEQQRMEQLFSAFVKAQASIEKAAKDKTNPHFRSKYADLGAVIDAIKPALEENDLGFIQRFHDNDKSIKVETIVIHKSGGQISCGVLSIPVAKLDAQGFGSACTYARRYSLQAAFGVAPEDDDGNAATRTEQRKEVPQKDKQSITDERLEKAIASIKANKFTTVELHSKFQLTPEQLEKLEQALTMETV